MTRIQDYLPFVFQALFKQYSKKKVHIFLILLSKTLKTNVETDIER